MNRLIKTISAILFLSAFWAVIPVTDTTAYAASQSNKTQISGLGTGAIGDPKEGNDYEEWTEEGYYDEWWTGSYVYYGRYLDPVKYRVLTKETSDFTLNSIKTVLLDCDSILKNMPPGDKKKYEDGTKIWPNGKVRKWLNEDFYNISFTDVEKGGIANSFKFQPAEGDGNTIPKSFFQPLTGEKVFLLDTREAARVSYGYSNNQHKSNNRVKGDKDWWTRSYGTFFDSTEYGEYSYQANGVIALFDSEAGVSPAFNLKLDSIISSSLVSGTAGAYGAGYKLTIKDPDLTIGARSVTKKDNIVTVDYVIGGDNWKNATQVSVLLLDSPYKAGTAVSGGYKYLKLNVNNWGSWVGTGTFTLPEEYRYKKCGSEYYAYILAEDVNSGNFTDYASSPVRISISDPTNYQITFNPNGGTVDPVSALTETNKKLSSLPTPTWADHEFEGWFTAASGGSKVTTDTVYSSNTEIFAHWKEKKAFKITLDPEGGTVDPTSVMTNTDGKLSSLPTPVWSGHDFTGWYYKVVFSDIKVSTSTVFRSDTTIFAKWKALPVYTVTFDPNGGTVDPESAVTGTDGKLSSLPTPEWSGHDFTGWFNRAHGGLRVTDATVYTKNTRIYAHWEATPLPTAYTVTFNPNGHNASVDPASGITGADGKLESLPTPEWNAHEFKGWYTSSDGGFAVTTDTIFSSNTEIYARWDAEPPAPAVYTVTFNPNSQEASVTPDQSDTGNEGKLTVELPTPQWDGHDFEGWFTAADGGMMVTNDTVFTASTEIYAHWKATPLPTAYKVTFNPNGKDASVDPTSGTTNTDGKLASLPIPVNGDREFEGWFSDIDGGMEITTDTVFSSDDEIFACWKEEPAPVTCTITYDANGGTVTPAQATTGADGTLSSIPVPVWGNRTFDGWFSDAEGGIQITEHTVFSSDMTIYAHWEETPLPATYTILFNPNGGTVDPGSGTTGVDGRLKSLPTPARDGYDFYGWFSTANGGAQITADTVFSSDDEIFANWRERKPEPGPTPEPTPSPMPTPNPTPRPPRRPADDNDDSSEEPVKAAVVNPDALIAQFLVNGTKLDNAKFGKQVQGPMGQAAFNSGRPLGWTQAFTFNMTVSDKADYSIKKGFLVMTIPHEYQKEGRTFAIMGLDQNGTPHIFNDTDTIPSTVTAKVNLGGYAFALIYKD